MIGPDWSKENGSGIFPSGDELRQLGKVGMDAFMETISTYTFLRNRMFALSILAVLATGLVVDASLVNTSMSLEGSRLSQRVLRIENGEIAYFNKAIIRDPTNAQLYKRRGVAWIKAGDYDRGIADFDKAIQLNPTDTDAYEIRGNSLASKGEYARAITDYDHALGLDPKSTTALRSRAWVKMTSGDTAGGGTDIDAANRIAEAEVSAANSQVTTMAAANGISESDSATMIRGMVQRLATRLKQNSDDVEGWLRLVRAYMVMGDREKANGAVTDARQAFSNNAERLKQLNEGLKNIGIGG